MFIDFVTLREMLDELSNDEEALEEFENFLRDYEADRAKFQAQVDATKEKIRAFLYTERV